MALNKNHQQHMSMMNAFDMAERNVPKDTVMGGSKYGMGAAGLPRTPAQQASVKKAAAASAAARSAKARGTGRSPTAPSSPPPGIATGGIALAKRPKGGLLG